MILASVTAIDTGYCVYSHRNSNGVLWIGRCLTRELLAFEDARANRKWVETVLFDQSVFTVIESFEPSELEANRTAFRLIGQYNPICNREYTPTPGAYERASPQRSRVMCNENGATYQSAAALAKATGVTASYVSSHLAGRKGFEKLKGLTFKRVQ